MEKIIGTTGIVTSAAPRPRWLGMVARIFAFTFLLTLLSFAVSLLVSLLVTIIRARIGHAAPNLTFAYRHVAFPFAVCVGVIVLLVTLAVEVRNYRQNKVLAAIERTVLNH